MTGICTVDGCNAESARRGMCFKHYKRVLTTGSTSSTKMPAKGLVCSVSGCDRPRYGKGVCSMHHQRLRNHGDVNTVLVVYPPKGEARRFYDEVVLTYEGADCLIWPFGRGGAGYAYTREDGKKGTVQRFLCEDVYGPPPTPKHEAAHSCGKGHLGCVAKGHLSWKTPKENSYDKVVHGTINRGERHGFAKITEAQAREIISLRGLESQYSVARRYGLSQSTVSDIQRGKHWAWLWESSK